MSVHKYFAHSEWDDDVPQESNNSIKFDKPKKDKKSKKLHSEDNVTKNCSVNGDDKSKVNNAKSNKVKNSKHDVSIGKNQNIKDKSKKVGNGITKNALKKLKRKKQKISSGEIISDIKEKLEKQRKEQRNKSHDNQPGEENKKDDGSDTKKRKKRKSSLPVDEANPEVKKFKVDDTLTDSNVEIQSNSQKKRRKRRKKNKQLNNDNGTENSDSTGKKNVGNDNAKHLVKSEETLSQECASKIKKNGKKDVFKNRISNLLQRTFSEDTTLESETGSGKIEEKKKKTIKEPVSLRQRMLEKIKGARFRYLNEQLYRKESKDAKKLFSEDPNAYEAYHDGYRQQVNRWPINPLDTIIQDISKLPKEYVIADLGCGDARLSKSIPHKCHSFDLVASDPSVQACDMAHTPLLSAQVNVVVFCLSLMGTNLKDYIIEANRILKVGGLLKIAEVESRFENVEEFIKAVQKFGFKQIKSDLTQNLFYFMDFKKEKEVGKRNKLPQIALKACLYKKR